MCVCVSLRFICRMAAQASPCRISTRVCDAENVPCLPVHPIASLVGTEENWRSMAKHVLDVNHADLALLFAADQ